MFTSKYVWDVFGSGHASPPVEAQKAVSHTVVECRDRLWVEITGPENVEEAWKAVDAGADAVALLVEPNTQYTSHYFIEPAQALAIRNALRSHPSNCEVVLMTHAINVAGDARSIVSLVTQIEPTMLSLFGDSSSKDIEAIDRVLFDLYGSHLKISKVVHVVDKTSIKEVEKYREIIRMVELDTFIPGRSDKTQVGGTGQTHDHELSRAIVEAYPAMKFILAGGLKPDNIEEAVDSVHPWGVDVCTGVKTFFGGPQDDAVMADFINKAHKYDRQGNKI